MAYTTLDSTLYLVISDFRLSIFMGKSIQINKIEVLYIEIRYFHVHTVYIPIKNCLYLFCVSVRLFRIIFKTAGPILLIFYTQLAVYMRKKIV